MEITKVSKEEFAAQSTISRAGRTGSGYRAMLENACEEPVRIAFAEGELKKVRSLTTYLTVLRKKLGLKGKVQIISRTTPPMVAIGPYSNEDAASRALSRESPRKPDAEGTKGKGKTKAAKV